MAFWKRLFGGRSQAPQATEPPPYPDVLSTPPPEVKPLPPEVLPTPPAAEEPSPAAEEPTASPPSPNAVPAAFSTEEPPAAAQAVAPEHQSEAEPPPAPATSEAEVPLEEPPAPAPAIAATAEEPPAPDPEVEPPLAPAAAEAEAPHEEASAQPVPPADASTESQPNWVAPPELIPVLKPFGKKPITEKQLRSLASVGFDATGWTAEQAHLTQAARAYFDALFTERGRPPGRYKASRLFCMKELLADQSLYAELTAWLQSEQKRDSAGPRQVYPGSLHDAAVRAWEKAAARSP